VLANTWFRKERRLITHESGECRTVVDNILSRKSDSKKNGQRCRDDHCRPMNLTSQVNYLLCVLDLMGRTGQCEVKLVKRFKVWKVKQAETEDIFRESAGKSKARERNLVVL